MGKAYYYELLYVNANICGNLWHYFQNETHTYKLFMSLIKKKIFIFTLLFFLHFQEKKQCLQIMGDRIINDSGSSSHIYMHEKYFVSFFKKSVVHINDL